MKTLLPILFLLLSFSVQAQTGGQHVYEFLRLSPSARVTGLGGLHTATHDHDLQLVNENPALLHPSMDKQLSFGNDVYLAGINHGNIRFAKKIDSLMTLSVGIQYIGYGNFEGTDVFGQRTADFKAGEYALGISASRQHNRWAFGITTKVILSNFETYRSLGLAADAGISWINPEKELAFSLVGKNIGTQLTTYADLKESIPFDLQFSVSKKLTHLPFRFSLLAHHLQVWDIRYDDPNVVEQESIIQDTEEKEKNYFADKLFRHIVIGGEVYLGKALRLRVGYNHQRKQEMKIESLGSLAGYSFGFGIHIKKIKVDYGKAFYNLAGSDNHFSIAWQF